MSSSEDEQSFYDADAGSDLDDFIASSDDENNKIQDQFTHERGNNQIRPNEDFEEEEDRIGTLTKALKPNEDYTQKVLKAHISVLVSTLGGPDHASRITPAPYKLGQDALPCLKDIKRWIQTVDQKYEKFDVALAIFDSGLVVNDLIVILCDWDKRQSELKKSYTNPNRSYHNTMMEKIAITCMELLVSLTWPIELTERLTENQQLHFNNVRKAQLFYKKHILSYNNGQTLKAILRLALPCLAQDKAEREPKDNAMLRLVIFFIRNILYLKPADLSIVKKSGLKIGNFENLPSTVALDDISRNAVLACFKKNKVLMFLLTISGAVGNDFDKEAFGNVTLECIHLLITGVEIKYLIEPSGMNVRSSNNNTLEDRTNNRQLQHTHTPSAESTLTSTGLSLQDLLKEETKRKKQQTDNISTRHGRFGSLLSIQSESSSYVVSGQEALMNSQQTLNKLDLSKKWRSPSRFKYDSDKYVQTTSVVLNGSSSVILREFIEMFLSSGCFNNLIKAVSWIISNSFTSLSDTNLLSENEPIDLASFFLVISWFFNYKRERNLYYISHNKTPFEDEDQLDYGSVGAALSDVNFVLVGQYLRGSFATKDWNSLHVSMICLREMLYISYSIFSSKSSNQDELDEEEDGVLQDKDLAEGIIRKLFSEADYISLLIQIPKTAAKHSPKYLNVVVSVTNIILKCFDSFANQDVHVFIRTKRRQIKKGISNEQDSLGELSESSSKQIIKERKLDFQRTETQFFHKDTVSTFIIYLSRFEELTDKDIKNCLAFFHRLFVVKKDFTGLYRLDFMNVLYKLRSGLPRSSSVRKTVDDFIYHFMKKLKIAFERFPIPVELLFPRFEDMASKTYLATGQILDDDVEYGDRPKLDDKGQDEPGYVDDWIPEPKKPKSLVFKDDIDIKDQIKILVSCLCQTSKGWVIEWIIRELDRIHENRVLGSSLDVLMPTPVIRRILISNVYLRLLLLKLGFKLPALQNDPTVLMNTISNDAVVRFKDLLSELFEKLNNQERDLALFDNFKVQRKSSENIVKEKKARKEKSQSRRHRRRKRHSDLSDDEERKEKPNRFDAEETLKSGQYVNSSDDESDEEKEDEFFSREERLRRLLDESGGIVNAQQLSEFRAAWLKLEKESSNVLVQEAALKSSSLFVNDSDNDADNDLAEPFGKESGDNAIVPSVMARPARSSVNVANSEMLSGSSLSLESDLDHASMSDSHMSDKTQEQKAILQNSATLESSHDINTRKRSRHIIDSDSDEDEEDEILNKKQSIL